MRALGYLQFCNVFASIFNMASLAVHAFSAARRAVAPGMRAASTMRFTKDHEYVRIDGKTATCGITDFAQTQLGDVVFVSLPAVGTTFKKGCVAPQRAACALMHVRTAHAQIHPHPLAAT